MNKLGLERIKIGCRMLRDKTSGIVAFLILILSFILILVGISLKGERLKERELRDISTHMYLENYSPDFTNVSQDYQNDLVNLHINYDWELHQNLTSKIKYFSYFFEPKKDYFNFENPSEDYLEYSWKKLLKEGELNLNLKGVKQVPDLRVIKARNPLNLEANKLNEIKASTYINGKYDLVDVIYFLVDSDKLKQEGANKSILENLWYESEYIDAFNLNKEKSSYNVLLPELEEYSSKSLVILSSNRSIFAELFTDKPQDFKLSDWLKASSFDAYMPTDDFELLLEIIPLEINPSKELIEIEEIKNIKTNEDDFFNKVTLRYQETQNRIVDYELGFIDNTQYYVNKSGFDFMSFAKQYCQENGEYYRFEACEFLHEYSAKYDLKLNNDKSAFKWVDIYLSQYQDRLRVFDYNGEEPINLKRNDLYSLRLDSDQARNFVSFMSAKNSFDLQTDLDLFMTGFIVDGPILAQNWDNLFNLNAILGYDLSQIKQQSESVFKASGPISDLTKSQSWTEWTMLGNQDLEKGTMVLVALDKQINPWLEDKSGPESVTPNKFAYSIKILNEAKVYHPNEKFDLELSLEEKAGIGLRNNLQLRFEFSNPEEVLFIDEHLLKDDSLKIKGAMFKETGLYTLKIKNQFGEMLGKYQFVVKEEQKPRYRIYLIPFEISDDYRQSAPEEGLDLIPYPPADYGTPEEDITEELEEDTPEEEDLECPNQAEIFEAFDQLRTDTWENYYIYEEDYQNLIEEYQEYFENYDCIIPAKKIRPTRIIYIHGGGGTDDPDLPPDPPDNIINHVFPMYCYVGRRTYNTEILVLENNTAGDQTVNFRIEADNNGLPPVEDNFSGGNADFWIFMSSIDSSGGAVSELPNPRDYGLLTQWHNTALQIEVVAGNILTANANMGPFVLPAGEKRQIATVFDCGVDMTVGETGVVRVTVETND